MIPRDLSKKIQLSANRVRCSECNSNSDSALFLTRQDMVFKNTFFRSGDIPMIRLSNKLKINSVRTIETGMILVRFCVNCGTARTVSLSLNSINN